MSSFIESLDGLTRMVSPRFRKEYIASSVPEPFCAGIEGKVPINRQDGDVWNGDVDTQRKKRVSHFSSRGSQTLGKSNSDHSSHGHDGDLRIDADGTGQHARIGDIETRHIPGLTVRPNDTALRI